MELEKLIRSKKFSELDTSELEMISNEFTSEEYEQYRRFLLNMQIASKNEALPQVDIKVKAKLDAIFVAKVAADKPKKNSIIAIFGSSNPFVQFAAASIIIFATVWTDMPHDIVGKELYQIDSTLVKVQQGMELADSTYVAQDSVQ